MRLMSLLTLCCLVVDSATDAIFEDTISDRDEMDKPLDINQMLHKVDRTFDNRRKRTCRIGLHSHNCAILDLDELKKIEQYLRSGHSPGKRSGDLSKTELGDEAAPKESTTAYETLENLVEQQRAMFTLRKLLQGVRAEPENTGQMKRDCRFRLGGHCLTEALDKAANQYYYLKSADSPGRRRRSVAENTPQY